MENGTRPAVGEPGGQTYDVVRAIPPEAIETVRLSLHDATSFIEAEVPSLELGFRVPTVEAIALFWPVARPTGEPLPPEPEPADDDPEDAF